MLKMLRPLDPQRDGAALHAIFGDERCCTYLPDPALNSVEETIALLERWTRGYEDTSWAIVDAPDGQALGRAALYHPGQDKDVWEAAIMLTPTSQGRGLAAPAMAEAIDFVFDKKGARRIFADIDPDNTPSLRVFEKLGFTNEGRARALWKTHIGVRDSIIMALIDEDPRVWRP